MEAISLFAGIGGFDLACELEGVKCVEQVEIDKAAQNVLRRYFPHAELYSDVKTYTPNCTVDLICGGFPCQDVSIAGRRAGLAGERSGLWHEFHRIIASSRPRWVIIENVPGLLSSNGGRDFAVILRGLAECGYGVAWRILDAQYFGVPQRRRRVFIVGSLGNGCAAQVLFESESLPGNTPPRRKAGEEVAYSIRANPSHSGDKGDGGINTTSVAHALSASKTATGRLDPNGQDFITTGTLDRKSCSANRGSQANEAEFLVAYNIQHNDGGEHRRKDRPNGGMYVNETEVALTVGTSDMTAIAQTLQHKGMNDKMDAGGKNASTQEEYARTILSALREEIGAEAFTEWGSRILDSFQQAKVLRQDLHGPSIRREASQGESAMDDSPLSREEDYEAWALCHLWEAEGSGCSPCRSKLAEQFIRKLTETLPKLPHESASKYGIRRLTPLEAERLQGFPDGWTKYYHKDGQCVIMGTWLKTFAQLRDAVVRLSTEKTESALCTTNDSTVTDVSIYQSATIPPLNDVRSVIGWLEGMERVDIVHAITNLGNDTAILCNQNGTQMSAQQIQSDVQDTIALSLNLLLVGPCNAEKLSTILTWTQQITPILISTFVEMPPSMVLYMLHWNEQLPTLSSGEYWCLKTANIAQQADSTRYRQLGNAVAVPVVRWIVHRIVAFDCL